MTDIEIEYKKGELAETARLSGIKLVGYICLPVFLAVVLIAAINFIVFRHFNYFYWVKPDTTMGTAVQAQDLVEHQLLPGARNVLVIGDSRVSEGFSAVEANAIEKSGNVHFVQSGMPGTEPRVWYYFLRKIDPKRNKFAAVVLMAPRFADDPQIEDASARVDDLTYLQPLTSWKDSIAIAASYPGLEGQIHAFTSMLLPLATARFDMLDFLKDPQGRVGTARLWHEHFYEWSLAYPGASGQVPFVGKEQLKGFNFAAAGLPATKIPAMDQYAALVLGEPSNVPPLRTAEYRRKWYGAIADAYRAQGVPVYVFQVPRGPYEAISQNKDQPRSALDKLGAEGKLVLLDPKPFQALEQPQYFFDSLHVNAAGRGPLTEALARLVLQQLSVSR